MGQVAAQFPGGVFVGHGRWTAQRALSELPETPESVIEVVDGSLVLSPRQSSGHQGALMRLCYALDKAARRFGLEALPEVDLVVGEDLACPDVVVLARPEHDRAWVDASDVVLVGELWSTGGQPSRFLRAEKYARAGIGHHLRVEFPGGSPVIVLHERVDGEYRLVAAAPAGTTFAMRTPFPFEIDPVELVER
jgi:hypothetical protein